MRALSCDYRQVHLLSYATPRGRSKKAVQCRPQNGTLFVETSAKANVAVSQAFEELVAKMLDTPSLLQVLGACWSSPVHISCTELCFTVK